eukprot:359426-Chlamydomonas_euryale.AAC.5
MASPVRERGLWRAGDEDVRACVYVGNGGAQRRPHPQVLRLRGRLRAPADDADLLDALKRRRQAGQLVLAAAHNVLVLSGKRHELLLEGLGVEVEVHCRDDLERISVCGGGTRCGSYRVRKSHCNSNGSSGGGHGCRSRGAAGRQGGVGGWRQLPAKGARLLVTSIEVGAVAEAPARAGAVAAVGDWSCEITPALVWAHPGHGKQLLCGWQHADFCRSDCSVRANQRHTREHEVRLACVATQFRRATGLGLNTTPTRQRCRVAAGSFGAAHGREPLFPGCDVCWLWAAGCQSVVGCTDRAPQHSRRPTT